MTPSHCFQLKQPKQLMILNYMMAMGAEYNYVINLDIVKKAVALLQRISTQKGYPVLQQRVKELVK